MSQIYNVNTKRPNPKENQLGILGISFREFTHFVRNLAEGLVPGESAAGTTYLYLRINSKSCYIFPLTVAAASL